MASKRAYAEEEKGEEEPMRKMPRLIASEPQGALEERGLLDSAGGDLIVRCGPWAWQCHQDVLTSRCSFLKACCEGGFRESAAREIDLPDDEPRAIQAMLRYLYTLDVTQIYRSDDPIFSDVERDLDVLVVADKYGLDKLRDYMHSNLVLFYETDKRPPRDPKGWSAKNQDGFGRVLRKLDELEMDTKDIRSAVARFIVRREGTVMKWTSVKSAMEDHLWLTDEVALAAMAAKRVLEHQVQCLQREVYELQEKLEDVEVERDEIYGELENLEFLYAGGTSAFLGWEDCDPGYCYSPDPYAARHQSPGEPIESLHDEDLLPDAPIEPLFVEDLLSGVSYVLGEDGPEPPIPESAEV